MTSFNVVYAAFYDKVQKDRDFFSYNNVSIEEAQEIAESRANGYLKEAITYLKLSCTPTVDFDNYSDSQSVFNFDLTNTEIQLLGYIMYLKYFEKSFVKMQAFNLHFTLKDLNYFSPANERNSFTDMYYKIKKDVDKLIDSYASRDRTTGALKGIDYSIYNEE